MGYKCKIVEKSPFELNLSQIDSVSHTVKKFAESAFRSFESISQLQWNTKEEYVELKSTLLGIRSEFDRHINKLTSLEIIKKRLVKPKRPRPTAAPASKVRGNNQRMKESGSQCKVQIPVKFKCAMASKSRDCNLVIHGGQFSAQSGIELSSEVHSFLVKHIKMDIPVLNARWLGNKKSILVNLESRDVRNQIFGNCHLLRNFEPKISLTEDVSAEIRRKRINLLPLLLSERRKGNKAYFRGGTLFVNGRKFSSDTENVGVNANLTATKLLKPGPKKHECSALEDSPCTGTRESIVLEAPVTPPEISPTPDGIEADVWIEKAGHKVSTAMEFASRSCDENAEIAAPTRLKLAKLALKMLNEVANDVSKIPSHGSDSESKGHILSRIHEQTHNLSVFVSGLEKVVVFS